MFNSLNFRISNRFTFYIQKTVNIPWIILDLEWKNERGRYFKQQKIVSPVVEVALLILLTIIFAYAIGSSSITGILQSYSTGLGMGGRLDGGELRETDKA